MSIFFGARLADVANDGGFTAVLMLMGFLTSSVFSVGADVTTFAGLSGRSLS